MASITRRTVLTGAAAATGAAALGFGGYELLRRSGPSESAMAGGNKPNILVVIVDEMRAPQWFPDQATLATATQSADCNGSVSFEPHYTAANIARLAKGDDHRTLFAPDRLFVHRTSGVDPVAAVSDLGHDPATTATAPAGGASGIWATLPTHPGRAGGVWLFRWHLSVAERRARSRTADGPGHRGRVHRLVRRRFGQRALVHDRLAGKSA